MKVRTIVFLIFITSAAGAAADGSSIGKIYYPYVQPLEKELEYQLLAERDNVALDKQRLSHLLGFGTAVSDKSYLELAVIYADQPSFELDTYELEWLYQLTEQGEYDSDWGMMVELEREENVDQWEAAIGLLNTKAWRRWELTTNVSLIREWGDGMRAEMEAALAMQTRYRYSPAFEPGLELFSSEDTKAIGPVISGMVKLATPDKLFWELGVLFGANDTTADTTLKFTLEYEFF